MRNSYISSSMKMINKFINLSKNQSIKKPCPAHVTTLLDSTSLVADKCYSHTQHISRYQHDLCPVLYNSFPSILYRQSELHHTKHLKYSDD